MKQVIEVTQKHINKGKRKSPYNCPVYYAIKEGIGISVGVQKTHFLDNRFKFPRSVLRFVHKFDKFGHKAVKPFKFFLEQI